MALEWMTRREACRILQISVATIKKVEKNYDWDTKMENVDGILKTLVNSGDIERYKERQGTIQLTTTGRVGDSSVTAEIVRWADSRKKWPDDSEIMKQVQYPYGYLGVVSILENRTQREKKFEWKGRAKAKRLPANMRTAPFEDATEYRRWSEHESNICEAAVGVGASH